MPDVKFWIGFALLAVIVGVGAVRLFFLLNLNIPAFTALLVKLLKAKDLDRYQRLLRAAGDVPASLLARRAFELRDQAATHQSGRDFVVGYRDSAPSGNFAAALSELLAPDLAAQKGRIRSGWLMTVVGFLAPIWLWFALPANALAPMIVTAVLVLVSINALVRARNLARGLDRMLAAIAPLLDPRN
jgi:hypothetical protein